MKAKQSDPKTYLLSFPCHLLRTTWTSLFSPSRVFSKHNFIPTVVTKAGALLAFHYETVVEAYGGCPITVAVGESEMGKSTAIRAGLSLFGCDEMSRYVKGTTAAFLERASRSTLPFAIEEAKGKKGRSQVNQVDLTELIVDLYNGSRMANLRTGSVKPRSITILATNFDVEQMERLEIPIPDGLQYYRICFALNSAYVSSEQWNHP